MAYRPARVTAFLQRITLDAARHQGAGYHCAWREPVQALAAHCSIGVGQRADIKMMTDGMADVARAIQIHHLPIGADHLWQPAALVIELVGRRHIGDDRHPRGADQGASPVDAAEVAVGGTPGQHQHQQRAADGAQPQRNTGHSTVVHLAHRQIERQQLVDHGEEEQRGQPQPGPGAAQEEAGGRQQLQTESQVVAGIVSEHRLAPQRRLGLWSSAVFQSLGPITQRA